MTKNVDESDERCKLLEEHEAARSKRFEQRRAVRAKVAELEDSDPRDDLSLDPYERELRAREWVSRVLAELPFADGLHLIARSSDEMQSFDGAERIKNAAVKRFAPEDAQLFIDALDLAVYFANVARWTAELAPGPARTSLLDAARQRVTKCVERVDGESREVAIRREIFAEFEELYQFVREQGGRPRPVWLNDAVSTAQQLSAHAVMIERMLRQRFPGGVESMNRPLIERALVAWVGFDGRAIAASVSDREKGRIGASLLAEMYGRQFSENQLRNELAELRANDPRFAAMRARAIKTVPPSSNER